MQNVLTSKAFISCNNNNSVLQLMKAFEVETLAGTPIAWGKKLGRQEMMMRLNFNRVAPSARIADLPEVDPVAKCSK